LLEHDDHPEDRAGPRTGKAVPRPAVIGTAGRTWISVGWAGLARLPGGVADQSGWLQACGRDRRSMFLPRAGRAGLPLDLVLVLRTGPRGI